jgi:hypothetical protein
VADTLSLIPTVLPEGLYLKSFGISGPDLKIDGESPSEGLLAQFITNLEGSSKYSEVTLSQLGTNTESGKITFRIDVKIK